LCIIKLSTIYPQVIHRLIHKLSTITGIDKRFDMCYNDDMEVKEMETKPYIKMTDICGESIISRHNKLGCMVEAWERIQRSKMPTNAKEKFTMHLFDGTRFLKMGENFYRSEENGANPLVYWR
jgi:hypothetical protein